MQRHLATNMMIENQRVHVWPAPRADMAGLNPSGGWPVHSAAQHGGGYPRNRLRPLSDLTPVRFSVSKSFLADGREKIEPGRVGGLGACGADSGAGRGDGVCGVDCHAGG